MIRRLPLAQPVVGPYRTIPGMPGSMRKSHALGRRAAVIVAVTVIAVGILTRSVGASHAGEVADCGPAGTFTIEAMVNGAGFESPPPDGVLRFEEGATLTL